MIYSYMQVQNFLHPTDEVRAMFKTKFLSGQAKRWLTHTRYSQDTSTEQMCWSKKIENKQMPHLIAHSHTEKVILLVITPLGSWTKTCAGMKAFFWRSYEHHLKQIFLHSFGRQLSGT